MRNLSIVEAVAKARDVMEEEIENIKRFASANFVQWDIFQRFLNNLDARLIRDKDTVSELESNQLSPLKARVEELERKVGFLLSTLKFRLTRLVLNREVIPVSV